MDFATPLFLFLFLPLILFVYWLSPPRFRPGTLVGASFFFYAWAEGRFVLVLFLSILANYLLVRLIVRCQHQSSRLTALFSTVAFNLAVMFAFKYPDFIRWVLPGSGINSMPLHLPLGISFFTFQAIAYAVDVHHQKIVNPLSPLRFSLFLSMFPKIAAGPIIRCDEVESALSGPTVSVDDCTYGAKRFIVGMGKKLLIADTLAKTADLIFALPPHELTTACAWLGIICYTLQIYFDFSGYSDMAIGLGRMLGFSFRENFDYPYISKSLTEFWRRWHISLSTWFRDYLYTPLLYTLMTDKIRQKIVQGKYRTNYRSLFCIVLVFTLCGWWHGATWNFIVWGLFHGLILATEAWRLGSVMKKMPSYLSHFYTLLIIMLSWVFFRSLTLGAAFRFVATMAGFGSAKGTGSDIKLYLDSELLIVLMIAITAAMPTARIVRERISTALPTMSRRWFLPAMEVGALSTVLLASLTSVAGATYKAFIYSRF